MNNLTDQQLLRDYAGQRSDAAFAELVRRHVDFVYSAALRMVRDAHLAEDVTQSVFVALSKSAGQLMGHPVLSGWLHRTAQNLAANAVRTEVRRRAREQEAVAMNELLVHESDAAWENIAPHLDAALGELSEPDRDALLLRYFEKKSAREMAQVLNVSEEAAQKRVNRAVERLRDFFSKRNVTIGASGLVVLLSANSVHAAPIGLTAAISTAATFAVTTVATATTATAAKTIAMTTLQKTLVATTLAVAVGTGIYEARQASTLRSEIQNLHEQQAPMARQIEQLQRERDNMASQLAASEKENEKLKSGQQLTELIKLRGDVGLLRSENERLAQLYTGESSSANDPVAMRAKLWLTKVNEIKEKLEMMPDKSIPELKLLNDQDWLDVASTASLDREEQFNEAFARLRKTAKDNLAPWLSRALREYVRANNNQLPPDALALKPFFVVPVEEAMLARYQLIQSGEIKWEEPALVETPVDEQHEVIFKIGATGVWYEGDVRGKGLGGSGRQVWGNIDDKPLNPQSQYIVKNNKESDAELKRFMANEVDERDSNLLARALKEYSAAHGGREPGEDPSEIIPYLKTPVEKATYDRLIQRHKDER